MLPEKLPVILPDGRTFYIFVDVHPTVPFRAADGTLKAQVLLDVAELQELLGQMALAEMSEEDKANAIPDLDVYDSLPEPEKRAIQEKVKRFDADRASVREVLGLPPEDFFYIDGEEDEDDLEDWQRESEEDSF